MAYFSMMLLVINPPLQQWQAPMHMQLSGSEKDGAQRAAITSTPLNLVAMQPCRLLDTRSSAPAIQRLIAGPIAANVAVEVPVRNGSCGLPDPGRRAPPVAVYRTGTQPITPFCATVVSNVVNDYAIREIDTDNAVTTGAQDWRFVAPVSGHYHVAATLDITQSATTYDLYKLTPSLVAAPPIRSLTVTGRPTTISTVTYLGAGEAIRTMSNATTSCGGQGWISIHYVRP